MVFFVIMLILSLSYVTHQVQATESVGERVLAALNRGYVYLRNGNYNRAIAEYTTALTLQPNSVNALINRGLAHIGIRDNDRAIADFTTALRIEPNNAHARGGLTFAEHARARQLQAQPAPTQPVVTQSAPAQATLPMVTQPAPTTQPGTSPFFTGNGGRGMTLAILEPTGSGLSNDELRWMPSLVQGSITGDFNLYSAITVVDRQNMETVLEQQGISMSGYFSDQDFIRIGHIVNAHYILTGTITRTATAYMLGFAVTNVQSGVRRASRPPTPVSLQALEDLSAVRAATIDILGQLGVNLTARGRQELERTPNMAAVQAQTALARGITAQREGLEAEALSHFIQANVRDPELQEAEDRLDIMTVGLARSDFGTGARQDIAWRRQWMERLEETEYFFASHTQRQSYFLIYDPNSIREGAINHQNETMELRFWMSLVPDPVWADTINQVVVRMASGLMATGRAGDWGIDWPNNPLSFSPPFNNRTDNLTVVAEIMNTQGTSIARQTVTIPAGFSIHSRVSRRVIPKQWEGDVLFPAVDVNLITDRLGIRIASINGVPTANTARQTGVTVMSNAELFHIAGIRRVSVDTSNFVVRDDGMLIRYYGGGTEVTIPFMVNGINVTAIGYQVFQGRGLTSVIIPDTVRSIGYRAFDNNQITDVIIPGSVTTIGQNAFSRNRLRNVDISDSAISIGASAFANNQMANVSIPGSVTSIGASAFRHNYLTNATIPDSVTTIGESAFSNNQVSTVTIGAYVDIARHGCVVMGWWGISPFRDAYIQNGRRTRQAATLGPLRHGSVGGIRRFMILGMYPLEYTGYIHW